MHVIKNVVFLRMMIVLQQKWLGKMYDSIKDIFSLRIVIAEEIPAMNVFYTEEAPIYFSNISVSFLGLAYFNSQVIYVFAWKSLSCIPLTLRGQLALELEHVVVFRDTLL